MKKKLLSVLLCAAMVASLVIGCGATEEPAAEEPAVTEEEAEAPAEEEAEAPVEEEAADEENYETGDASLDNTRNQDEIGEDELLVVSFGTSFNDNRRLTIGAIEEKVEAAFPEYSVRRGFTSQIIIDHVMSRDNVKIDNVTEALDRAVANGVKNLVVQPTLLMNGIEYEELTTTLAEYSDSFESVTVGEPLLTSDEDFQKVATAIVDATAEYDDGKTAIVFMGHGTHHDSNAVYAKMQTVLTEGGHTNYFVGTVEGSPMLDEVMPLVEAGGYERVVLRPLMIVAGDHASNDMAGLEEAGAWAYEFKAAGYEVVSVVEGLGQIEAIQDLIVEHTQAAVDSAK